MNKYEKKAMKILKGVEKEYGIEFTKAEREFIIIAMFKFAILELGAK